MMQLDLRQTYKRRHNNLQHTKRGHIATARRNGDDDAAHILIPHVAFQPRELHKQRVRLAVPAFYGSFCRLRRLGLARSFGHLLLGHFFRTGWRWRWRWRWSLSSNIGRSCNVNHTRLFLRLAAAVFVYFLDERLHLLLRVRKKCQDIWKQAKQTSSPRSPCRATERSAHAIVRGQRLSKAPAQTK
jgi:hypothetical protein